jgi:hypothetical protein
MKAIASALFAATVAVARSSSPFCSDEFATDHHAGARRIAYWRARFRDGIPSAGAAAKLYDYLDLTHGVEVFLNGFSGVSMYAIHKGFRDAGVKD